MNPGIKVFAPASVANVAAGFDILGFALERPGMKLLFAFPKLPVLGSPR